MQTQSMKNTYAASPTAAIPTQLPGIKWMCTAVHFPTSVHHASDL